MSSSVLLQLFVIANVITAYSASAKPRGFYLEQLPKGKNVTLPRPTAFVRLDSRVTVASTDLPQSLRLSAITMTGKKTRVPIEVAIYDSAMERVRYIKIGPGFHYLYSFHDLAHISLVPNVSKSSVKRNVRLRIESDKPLFISR